MQRPYVVPCQRGFGATVADAIGCGNGAEELQSVGVETVVERGGVDREGRIGRARDPVGRDAEAGLIDADGAGVVPPVGDGLNGEGIARGKVRPSIRQ